MTKPTLTRDQLQIICDRRRKQVRPTSDDAPFRGAAVLEAQRTKDGKPGPLAGMDWSGEDFTGCDLRGADLSHCCFDGADFRDADLWDADLRESDLRGARHILPAQLAATDLVGAQLPEGLAEFDTLKTVDALSVSSAKVFFTLLLAVVYVVLTAGTVRDAQLLTGAQSLKLPVIDVTSLEATSSSSRRCFCSASSFTSTSIFSACGKRSPSSPHAFPMVGASTNAPTHG